MSRLRRWLVVGAWLYGLAVSGAVAQPVIQSVRAVMVDGLEAVRVELSQPPQGVPAGFLVQDPPRIAIDLPGIRSALVDNVIDLGVGNARQATVAEAGDRARLVLSLRRPAGYRIAVEGQALVVVLGGDGPAAPAPAADAGPPRLPPAGSVAAVAAGDPAAPASPPPAANASSWTAAPPAEGGVLRAVKGIDFRRTAEGAARIVVELPGTEVGVDIVPQGRTLVVDFRGVGLPELLRRRLDVSDFATPVQAISTQQEGDKVRMVVEPSGAWEHSAYQADTRFVLEVRPLRRADPNQLARGGGYTGEKLSLNFQNIDVRALLQVIADFTNFNVVTSDTVAGTVTLRLKDVPWDQALDIILQSKGLGVRKVGNVLRVAPAEELNARDQAELEAQRRLADLEAVRTQSFQLNYTKAEELARALTGTPSQGAGRGAGAGADGAAARQQLAGLTGAPGSGVAGLGGGAASAPTGRILSARGSVIPEARTNQLFVTDIPSVLEQVQSLIEKVDIPVRQVLIEARIVEASDTFGRSLGIKLGGNDLRGQQGGVPGYAVGGGNNLMFGTSYGAIGAQTNQTGGGSAFNDGAFVNLPADTSRIGGVTAATFALSLFSASANRFLNLELSALEAEGRGKIVSSPRVITADQVKALIEQGEELPFQAATSSGATAVEFRKANLKLEVVPQITPEGNVILDVDINKDSVGRTTPAGFAIDTKHVKTQVLVENGGTVVIGGIFTQTETEQLNKVPLLGDLPVMGHLFKNRARSLAKTELLVFITPKVVVDDRSAAR